MESNKRPLNPAILVIVTAVVSIVATVWFLHKEGKIKHTENKTDYALSEYRVVYIDQQEEGYRLSHKPSHQTAKCVEGYLFIESDKQSELSGLLVDYKNRGVKCNQSDSPASEQAPTASQ